MTMNTGKLISGFTAMIIALIVSAVLVRLGTTTMTLHEIFTIAIGVGILMAVVTEDK